MLSEAFDQPTNYMPNAPSHDIISFPSVPNAPIIPMPEPVKTSKPEYKQIENYWRNQYNEIIYGMYLHFNKSPCIKDATYKQMNNELINAYSELQKAISNSSGGTKRKSKRKKNTKKRRNKKK